MSSSLLNEARVIEKERRIDYGDWFDDIYVAEKNGAYLAHERFAHNEAEKKAYAIELLHAEHQTIGLSAFLGVELDAYDSTFKLNVPVTMALDVFFAQMQKGRYGSEYAGDNQNRASGQALELKQKTANVKNKWENSTWGRMLIVQKKRASLNDFRLNLNGIFLKL
ncbi:60S ribosomal protein like protein [Tanacetum coccineum]